MDAKLNSKTHLQKRFFRFFEPFVRDWLQSCKKINLKRVNVLLLHHQYISYSNHHFKQNKYLGHLTKYKTGKKKLVFMAEYIF
jgi:hypothetical protein